MVGLKCRLLTALGRWRQGDCSCYSGWSAGEIASKLISIELLLFSAARRFAQEFIPAPNADSSQ